MALIPYGHRYKTDLAMLVSKDQARPSLKRNTDVDKFVNGKYLPDRGDGCVYKGYDAPGKEYSPQSQEVHFHLKFYGGPYDACNNVKVGTWEKVGGRSSRPRSTVAPTPPKTKPGGTYVEPKAHIRQGRGNCASRLCATSGSKSAGRR